MAGPLGRFLQRVDDLLHVALHRVGELAHFLRILVGRFRQSAYFVGDDREAATVLAGSCRFDRSIERQQVRLIRNPADGFRDLTDVLRARVELGDDVDGRQLAFGIALDRAHRCDDLRRGFRQRRDQRLGAAPGSFGFGARSDQTRDDALDRGRLLLRRAGRFLGAGGDLLHRAPELLGGGRGFREAARELLGRGCDALENRLRLRGGACRAVRLRRRRACCGLGVDGAGATVGFAGAAAIFDFFTNAIGPRRD